jgi:hypothetical protein
MLIGMAYLESMIKTDIEEIEVLVEIKTILILKLPLKETLMIFFQKIREYNTED